MTPTARARTIALKRKQSKADKNASDRIYSQIIRHIGHCERCGEPRKEQLQTSHIHSRRFINLRVDLDNATCLCAACHGWWSDHPILTMAWLETVRTPEQIARLLAKPETGVKVDWAVERARLTQIATELGIVL